MILSFTGTRQGLTDAQHATLAARLARVNPEHAVAHHGACVGADAEFDALCASFGIPRTAHPAFELGHPMRAACEAEVVLPVAPIWTRNAAIVQAAVDAPRGVLLACPAEETEQPTGGTWGTARLARGRVLVVLILPSGRLERWEVAST